MTAKQPKKRKKSRAEDSMSETLRARIAKRAYELYVMRGHRECRALDDWLVAEREILSRLPPV